MDICRHCSQFKITRPRNLCWRCFRTPEIRAKYTPTSKYAGGEARQERLRNEEGLPPVAPTPWAGKRASLYACRGCKEKTYNASRFCVACIRIAEGAAA